MTAVQEIALSKLMPSTANVRRTGKTDRVEELAASIGAHGLLQNLTVKPTAKGKFEVIAGGRRLAALKLLAKRKAWDALVPCQVMEGDNVTEISLAENALQAPMHPADQFEAFAALNSEGMGVEDIAARFGVTPQVVTQRLKLGAVSPKLMDAYRAGELNLDQLSAFAITDDHEAQERVWAGLGYSRSRWAILEALSEGQVSSNDRRALFVGMEAYLAAGGGILRDLFDEEAAGFFTDAALLESLVTAKLEQVAEGVRAEGWKWVAIEPEFDYGMASAMRRIYPEPRELSADDEAKIEELTNRYNELCDNAEGDADNETLLGIDAEIEAIRGDEIYDPDDKAIAGAFVSLGGGGEARVERGFIRRDDDPKRQFAEGSATTRTKPDANASLGLPEKLAAELTAHRSAALTNEVAQRPELGLAVVVHAMALHLFYHGGRSGSCLDIAVHRPSLTTHAKDIETSTAGVAIEQRHRCWQSELPSDPARLWGFVAELPMERQMALMAHCASLSIDAVVTGIDADALAHANVLAAAVALDMTRYWQPTAEGFFERLTKPQILDAVREATSPEQAQTCAAMKKPEMAARAEKLVAPTGWLPEILR